MLFDVQVLSMMGSTPLEARPSEMYELANFLICDCLYWYNPEGIEWRAK